MLNSDITMGAVVVGRKVDAHGWTFEDVEALSAAVAEHDAECKVFVAGDTSGDSGEEDFMESIVVGIPVVTVETHERPAEITPAMLASAIQRCAAQHSLWESLLAADDRFAFGPSDQTWLLSYGPLCYAALIYGDRRPALKGPHGFTKPTEGVLYQFHSMQDMDQSWGADGADGVSLGGVEFGEARSIDLSAQALAERAQTIPLIAAPKLLLTARYD